MKNTFILLFVFALVAPASVFAQGGFVRTYDIPSGMGIVDGASFSMTGKANRAYLCALRVSGSKSSISTSVLSSGGTTISGRRANSVPDAELILKDLVSVDPADDQPIDNLVFFTTPSGDAENGKYTLTIGISSGSPSSVSANCFDTTFVCEFNTFLGQFNYLELTNLGSSDALINLSLVDFDGTETAIPGTTTVPPGLRRDLDMHTAAGPNRYGYVVVKPLNILPAFNSGSFRAKLSTYKNGEFASSVTCSGFGAGID